MTHQSGRLLQALARAAAGALIRSAERQLAESQKAVSAVRLEPVRVAPRLADKLTPAMVEYIRDFIQRGRERRKAEEREWRHYRAHRMPQWAAFGVGNWRGVPTRISRLPDGSIRYISPRSSKTSSDRAIRG